MSVYYFVTMPKLPVMLSYRENIVEMVEYTAKEGQHVEAGTGIAVVKNWWAKFQIEATGRGYLSKTFFDRGTLIEIGDPIAIIICEPEDAKQGQPTASIRVLERLRDLPDK